MVIGADLDFSLWSRCSIHYKFPDVCVRGRKRRGKENHSSQEPRQPGS